MFWNNSFPDKKTGLNYPPAPSEEKDFSITRLFEDILCAGSILRVKVTGRSMAPFLKAGEIATIVKVGNDHLHRGDLIFFKNNINLPFLHRFVHKKKGAHGTELFLTKGDALRSLDEPVRGERILGKVVQIEKIRDDKKVVRIDMESKQQRLFNFALASGGLIQVAVFRFLNKLRA